MENGIGSSWDKELREYILKVSGESRDYLQVGEFSTQIHLTFEDGSYVFFRHAICIISHQRNEVAVFTEHCGNCAFPLLGTRVEVLKPQYQDFGMAETVMTNNGDGSDSIQV